MNCNSVFVDPKHLVDPELEKQRYLLHNNDVFDSGYRASVYPIVKAVCEDFSQKHKGLDFGAGPGKPIVTTMLEEKKFSVSPYDPFFHPDSALLDGLYHYITCSEAVEHFYHPENEFQLLNSLLMKNGKLYIKTKLWHDNLEFKSWKYRNDYTHVFFYSFESFQYIKDAFAFSSLEIRQPVIILTK